MRYITQYAIPAGTTNATTTGTKISPAVWWNLSFMGVFTDGAAAGTLKIQYSNDNPAGNTEENFTPTNWADVPGATATASVAAGASTTVYVPQAFVGRWYRVVFTRSAGAGTFFVTYCGISV